MKKVCILLVAAILIWAVLLFRFGDIRMWIPTDFSAEEEQVAFAAEDTSKHYYADLSTDGKVAYNRILEQIRLHPEEIEIPVLSQEDFQKMFQALSYDNPDLLCIRNESQIVKRGAKAYFVPQYTRNAQTCAANESALKAAVQRMISGVPANADLYTVELYLHDALCSFVTYETADDAGYTAFDALVDGRAVCEGYARAFQLLLNCVGIPNYLVTGTGINAAGDTEGHMWNLVDLDGQRYYVDTTWDDLDSVAISRYSHTYFNVSDSDVQNNHLNMIPADNQCIYEQYNYFVYNNWLFNEYNADTRAYISRCIKTAVLNEDLTFEIRFANREIYAEAFTDLIDNGEIYVLAQKADRNFLKKYADIMYVQDEQMLTIQFAFV